MQTRKEYIAQYALSHRNPLNQKIHMVCVPAIFFASVGLGWVVKLPGLDLGAATSAFNLSVIASLPILAFYARLGAGTLATMLAWFALSFAGCAAIEAAGLPLLWISVAMWVLAWAVQFYGHEVEGAKPSFLKDIFFLLIGPLYVQDKFSGAIR